MKLLLFIFLSLSLFADTAVKGNYVEIPSPIENKISDFIKENKKINQNKDFEEIIIDNNEPISDTKLSNEVEIKETIISTN